MDRLRSWARKRVQLFKCSFYVGVCEKCAPYRNDPQIREF